MRLHILPLVQHFYASERVKLRRYLSDRIRFELDLSSDEVEAEVAALIADGWIRLVDISHYDPAAADVTVEAAVTAGHRWHELNEVLIAG